MTTSASSVGIGVIGAGSMVARRAVLPAIDASAHAHIAAVSSLSNSTPARWQHFEAGGYDAVLDHPDVDAVYIPLPNGLHFEWTLKAAAAGKHVLCEKPIAPTVDESRAMTAACDSAGVLLAEAWMTPFDPRWAYMAELVEDGFIGEVHGVDAEFTFTIGSEGASNFRWLSSQGGGALLDVGIYCLGPAVGMWGPNPDIISVDRRLAPSGVDESTTALLRWPGGQQARIECSFVDAEGQRLTILGADGNLQLREHAHTGGNDACTIVHVDRRGNEHHIKVPPGDPYEPMIDAFARAVLGVARWPRPVERSTEMIGLLTRLAEAAD